MPKTTSKTNFRVVVFPYTWLASNEELVCQSIQEQIERHVDRTASISLDYDIRATCEFCGKHWTEDSDQYNGGCCKEDIAYNMGDKQR
jgi:hypothetical protein